MNTDKIQRKDDSMSAGISILVKRGDAELEYGVSRHFLDEGVKSGRVVVYAGPAAGKQRRFFRVDVAAFGGEKGEGIKEKGEEGMV